MSNHKTVGERIRTYRENLAMSPADLAGKSGVDLAIVEAVEKGDVMPALGVLTKLSRALGQRLGTFMDDQFKPDPIVTRAEDLDAAKIAGRGVSTSGYEYQSLALGKPDRHMDPFRIELKADEASKPSSHEGEELVICLAGEVEFTYGPDKTVLKPGDTAYYNSCVTHSLRAVNGTASIYGIVYMPF